LNCELRIVNYTVLQKTTLFFYLQRKCKTGSIQCPAKIKTFRKTYYYFMLYFEAFYTS
jgi:hypothetical protein